MSPEAPTRDRPLASDDPALHPGWPLLEYLLSVGADEFAVRFMYARDDGKDARDQLMGKLAFASLGDRTRECTVAYDKESNPRPVGVWRFDPKSLDALRDVMPAGILRSGDMGSAWAEDLCVYRGGELLFGTVTHEQYAFLRLSDAEWRRWETHLAASRRAT
jgi:hypothetical protein